MVLVSFRPRVVFIKTYKTAGSSVEGALQRMLISKRVLHSQGWVLGSNGFATPRLTGVGLPFARAVIWSALSPLPWQAGARLPSLRNHSTPQEIQNALGTRFFKRALKVVNVRNAFDLLLSNFFYKSGGKSGLAGFSDFLKASKPKGVNDSLPSWVDGSWKILRFESLEADFAQLALHLGFGPGEKLPRWKTDTRPPETRDYRKCYSVADRKWVEKNWGDWMECFGYRW